MRYLIFSDLHFHHTHHFSHITREGFTIRELEHLSCADVIIDLVEKEKIDKVVFLGDLFGPVGDSLSGQTLAATSKFVSKIAKRTAIDLLVGNHDRCLDINTEILTENGWKKYNEINDNTRIAQVDLNTDKLSFAKPINRIYKNNQRVFECTDGAFNRFCVTPDHDIIYNNIKVRLDVALTRDAFLFGNLVKKQIAVSNTVDYNIDDNILKLLVWIITDGTVVYEKYTTKRGISYEKFKRIQWHLKRKDKIENLQGLLNILNIHYTITPDYTKANTVYIKIFTHNADLVISHINKNKDFPQFFKYLSKRQADIVLETLLKTDGSMIGKCIEVAFIKENNIDILQELFFRTGYVVEKRIKSNKYGFNKNGILYRLKIRENLANYGRQHKVRVIKEKTKDVFCFTMPKGTLVTRYKGSVTILGNCSSNDIANLHKLEVFKNYQNVNVYDAPTIQGNFIYAPYCNSDQYIQAFLENIPDKENKIVFSHLEIKGFPLGNGIETQHGVELSLLKKFKMVLQGHYHCGGSLGKNIQIAGSTQRLSFKDQGKARNNILIYNTETNTVERRSFTCPDWLTFTDENIDLLLKTDVNNYVKVELSTDILLTDEIKQRLQAFKGVSVHIDLNRISVNKQIQEDVEAESESDILRQFINKSDNSEQQKEALIEEGIRLLEKVK